MDLLILTLPSKDEAVLKGKEAVALMPNNNWEIVIWKYDGWHFRIQNLPVAVYPLTNGKWKSICGWVNEDGIIHSGPWDASTIHDHPGKAAMITGESLQEYTQSNLELFNAVCCSLEGLEEFETPKNKNINSIGN